MDSLLRYISSPLPLVGGNSRYRTPNTGVPALNCCGARDLPLTCRATAALALTDRRARAAALNAGGLNLTGGGALPPARSCCVAGSLTLTGGGARPPAPSCCSAGSLTLIGGVARARVVLSGRTACALALRGGGVRPLALNNRTAGALPLTDSGVAVGGPTLTRGTSRCQAVADPDADSNIGKQESNNEHPDADSNMGKQENNNEQNTDKKPSFSQKNVALSFLMIGIVNALLYQFGLSPFETFKTARSIAKFMGGAKPIVDVAGAIIKEQRKLNSESESREIRNRLETLDDELKNKKEVIKIIEKVVIKVVEVERMAIKQVDSKEDN